MKTVWVGVDNGVSGSIGIITSENEVKLLHTPIKKCLNYTKEKKFLNRIDFKELCETFFNYSACKIYALIERPLVNPSMFNATASALRAYEATILALEEAEVGYTVTDSKEWQKALLPHGLHKEQLKMASLDVAKRLFPKVDFKGFKDGDGLLIAEYCRRLNTGDNK